MPEMIHEHLFFLSFRAKIFRGKKVQGDYDIKVEQVKHLALDLRPYV